MNYISEKSMNSIQRVGDYIAVNYLRYSRDEIKMKAISISVASPVRKYKCVDYPTETHVILVEDGKEYIRGKLEFVPSHYSGKYSKLYP